jgi:hypothetical protein
LCYALYDAAKYEESIAEGQKALQYKDDDPALHFEVRVWIGKSLTAQGKVAEARKQWQYVIDHFPISEDTFRFSALTMAKELMKETASK